MEQFLSGGGDAAQLSPLTLAFIGDAVFELFVREHIVHMGNCQVGKLHRQSVELVNCAAQAEAMEKLKPLLSEEEAAVYRRGRNAHPKTTPKNASIKDYHDATGLEALFGYLYLSGQTERLREFFNRILSK